MAYPSRVIPFAILLSVIAGPAYTQERLVLDEIIVTAQKREQSLREVPATVNVLGEDLMNKSITTTFKDIQNLTSGVQFGGAPRDGFQSTIKIRGIGTAKNNPGIDPRVGIFIDNIPFAKREQAFANLNDVAQIEVLKGPQSTLFGKSVSSGAITIATKRPSTEAIDAFANANLGSNDLRELSAGGNLPLGDMFAVRASVYYDEEDGFIKNVRTGSEEPEFEAWGYRVRFLFEPNENFDAVLGYEYNDSESHGSNSFKIQAGDLTQQLEDISGTNMPLFRVGDRKRAGVADGRTIESEVASLHLTWHFADQWTFDSITAYQDWRLKLNQTRETRVPGQSALVQNLVDRTNTQAGLPFVPGGFADTSIQPELLSPFFTNQGARSTTQEFRFTFASERWSSIYGVFYADTVNTDNTPLLQTIGFLQPALGPPMAGTQIVQALVVDSRDEIEDIAVFTHHTYTFSPRLSVVAGLRYARIDKDSRKGIFLGQGPFAPIQNTGAVTTEREAPKQSDNWSDLSGTLSLSYNFTEDLTAYVGYGRAFKPGGFNTANPNPITNAPVAPEAFDEETVDAFEIGFKADLLGGALRWNGAAFVQIFDDFQVETTTPQGFALINQNAAKVRSEGVEMDIEWQATRQLNLVANVSYVNARYRDFDNATCVRPQFGREVCEASPPPPNNPNGPPATFTRDLGGKRLDNVAPWTANVFATWADSLLNTGWNYYLRGEYIFRDDIFFQADLDPDLSQSSYSLFNGSIGFISPDERYSIILWGKNLTDKEYAVDLTRSRDFTQSSAPPGVMQPPGGQFEGFRGTEGLSRTVGVQFRYMFAM